MLAYLISRKHVPTKGVLCILELDAKESSLTQLIFLIACRNILFRVEVICYWVRSKWITTSTIIVKWQNAVHPRPRYSIPQTDSTKPISRLKRM
jgi:hypothetical protein